MQSAAPVRGQRPRESDMLPQNNTRQAHQIIAAISVNSQSQTEAGLRTKESLYGSSLAKRNVELALNSANANFALAWIMSDSVTDLSDQGPDTNSEEDPGASVSLETSIELGSYPFGKNVSTDQQQMIVFRILDSFQHSLQKHLKEKDISDDPCSILFVVPSSLPSQVKTAVQLWAEANSTGPEAAATKSRADSERHPLSRWAWHILPRRAFDPSKSFAASVTQACEEQLQGEAFHALFGLHHHLRQVGGHEVSPELESNVQVKPMPILDIRGVVRVNSLMHLPSRTREALGMLTPQKVAFKAIGGHGLSSASIDIITLLDRCLTPSGRKLLASQVLSPPTAVADSSSILDMVEWIHTHHTHSTTSVGASQGPAGQQSHDFRWRQDSSNNVVKTVESIMQLLAQLGDVGQTLRKCASGHSQASMGTWTKGLTQLQVWQLCIARCQALGALGPCPFSHLLESPGLGEEQTAEVQSTLDYLHHVLQLSTSGTGPLDDDVDLTPATQALLPSYMDTSGMRVVKSASEALEYSWGALQGLSSSILEAAEERGQALEHALSQWSAERIGQPTQPDAHSRRGTYTVRLINHKYFGACWSVEKESAQPLFPTLNAQSLMDALAASDVHVEPLAAVEAEPFICFSDAFTEAANKELRAACQNVLREQGKIHERACLRLKNILPVVEAGIKVLDWFDLACAFSSIAQECAYARPDVMDSKENGPVFDVVEGRHPIQELLVPQFFANSIPLAPQKLLDSDTPPLRNKKAACLIIAGANSSGKSVLLKQAGLTQVLAQAGCFVPAQAARISAADGIYTRISTSDRVWSGVSAFHDDLGQMVLMAQAASSGVDCLCLVDEFGKGTLQDDGEALLTGFVAFFAQQKAAKCIVATHYNMHTALQNTRLATEEGEVALSDLVQVAHMGSVTPNDSDTKLIEDEDLSASEELEQPFRLLSGWTTGSKALHCARQNGIQESVVARAASILKFLRSTRQTPPESQAASDYKREGLVAVLKKVGQENQSEGT